MTDQNLNLHIGLDLLYSHKLVDICLRSANRWVLVTDTRVEKLYGNDLQQHLQAQGLKVDLIAFPAGEEYKTRSTKEWVEDQMLSRGLGRDSGLIALGGGVVTDLGGFVAATYCRGIPLIQISTTLLGMVDASIGGKTAVNVPSGKNMIGTLYWPLAVFMDISILKSLPLQELQNGIVECIKHGVILDAAYFDFLEKNSTKILEGDLTSLQQVIRDSCQIKLNIVQKDEAEIGIRRLLNFGHTLGHALEILTHHEVPHGQAVALGMIGEGYLSMKMGILPKKSFERICSILDAYGISKHVKSPPSPDEFLNAMKMDKKALKSSPRFVILKEIGECLECEGQYCQSVDLHALQETVEWLCQEFNH